MGNVVTITKAMEPGQCPTPKSEKTVLAFLLPAFFFLVPYFCLLCSFFQQEHILASQWERLSYEHFLPHLWYVALYELIVSSFSRLFPALSSTLCLCKFTTSFRNILFLALFDAFYTVIVKIVTWILFLFNTFSPLIHILNKIFKVCARRHALL